MHLILIPKNSEDSSGESLLKFALTSEPIAGIIFDGLSRCLDWNGNQSSILGFFVKLGLAKIFCAVPEEWSIEARALQNKNGVLQRPFFNAGPSIIHYKENVPIPDKLMHRTKRSRASSSWLVISNGRFATHINTDLLKNVLTGVKADVVALNVEPELLGKREKVRLTPEGKIGGFCRLYSDSVEFAPISADWPHHLFVKTKVLDQILVSCALPQSFSDLVERFRLKELRLCAINVGGTVLDLETASGLLNFCGTRLSKTRNSKFEIRDSNTISQSSRLIGKVLLGKNIQIGPKVIVVGPTIISNNVKIEGGAIINSSVIGPDICVPRNKLVQNSLVKGPQYIGKQPVRHKTSYSKQTAYLRCDVSLPQDTYSSFRTWPRFSYARFFKRIVDFFAALIVLVLFAPLMPFVALAIRLNSPGPVFYKDKRQGLHGRNFDCLKFRTMVTGADKIQEKLRVVSQVDGPQFKMVNDPRISTVGRFLRETYIDEIPQFFNVLFGQMSVVGPRPSPESENTLCPFWRDARLSIRPGITGLWQVRRTRQPMKDFQEWIHYDVEYVRNLSPKMDLWICWQTIKKLFDNFISQF